MKNLARVVTAAIAVGVTMPSAIGQIAGTLKPRADLKEFLLNGNVVRTFFADLKGGQFVGNAVTRVTGTAEITNQYGNNIAKGKLEIVDGAICIRGRKGASFKCYAMDGFRVADGTPKKPMRNRPARVTLTQDDFWILEDKRFCFLIDSSYGLTPAFSASFARNTRIELPPRKPLNLGDVSITAGERGGHVEFLHGCIVGKQDVTVAKRDVEKRPPPGNAGSKSDTSRKPSVGDIGDAGTIEFFPESNTEIRFGADQQLLLWNEAGEPVAGFVAKAKDPKRRKITQGYECRWEEAGKRRGVFLEHGVAETEYGGGGLKTTGANKKVVVGYRVKGKKLSLRFEGIQQTVDAANKTKNHLTLSSVDGRVFRFDILPSSRMVHSIKDDGTFGRFLAGLVN